MPMTGSSICSGCTAAGPSGCVSRISAPSRVRIQDRLSGSSPSLELTDQLVSSLSGTTRMFPGLASSRAGMPDRIGLAICLSAVIVIVIGDTAMDRKPFEQDSGQVVIQSEGGIDIVAQVLMVTPRKQRDPRVLDAPGHFPQALPFRQPFPECSGDWSWT